MEWDEEKLTALIQEHRASVRQTLRYFTEDAGTLADLEQETFLRALVSLPSLRQVSAFGPWVRAIARHVALGQLRTARREQAHQRTWAAEISPLEPIAVAEAGLIENALQQLPAATAQILRLGYFEGLDSQTIAQRLGISAANARQRLSRGRAQLKEIIVDTVRQDREMAEALVQRLLHTARSLSEQGRYQEAVEKFLEAFNEFPSSLTALSHLPEEVRAAMHQAWGQTYQYHPPEAFEEPAGATDWEEYAGLWAEIPEEERGELIGTIEDIARRLQVSPAWVYLWWKQGVPHCKIGEDRIIRFDLALVRQWLKKNDIALPEKVTGADSYFLVKGMVYGLREGILSPEDIEVMAEVFICRDQRWGYRTGSFHGLSEVGQGAPLEARKALSQSRQLLTQAHQLAVHLRETWTPNCGYTGPYPYDQENRQRIAGELRQMAAWLQEAEQQLGTAATSLD